MRNLQKTSALIAAVLLVCTIHPSKSHAQASGPSDPQIVQIVQTANHIDIDQAKLALRMSKNPLVKDFASQMISDHQSLEKSVADLAKKLGVTPEDSDTSKQLNQQAADEAKKLKSLHGKAFDQEYVSHEIAFHQAVLDAAGKVLIPNARNGELKAALQGAAPLLQGHLEHAQHMQSSLQSGK